MVLHRPGGASETNRLVHHFQRQLQLTVVTVL